MSSLPSRLAKRALQARGFVREWVKPKHNPDTAFPHRVLDADGEPIAQTWVQAAVVAKRRAEQPA